MTSNIFVKYLKEENKKGGLLRKLAGKVPVASAGIPKIEKEWFDMWSSYYSALIVINRRYTKLPKKRLKPILKFENSLMEDYTTDKDVTDLKEGKYKGGALASTSFRYTILLEFSTNEKSSKTLNGSFTNSDVALSRDKLLCKLSPLKPKVVKGNKKLTKIRTLIADETNQIIIGGHGEVVSFFKNLKKSMKGLKKKELAYLDSMEVGWLDYFETLYCVNEKLINLNQQDLLKSLSLENKSLIDAKNWACPRLCGFKKGTEQRKIGKQFMKILGSDFAGNTISESYLLHGISAVGSAKKLRRQFENCHC